MPSRHRIDTTEFNRNKRLPDTRSIEVSTLDPVPETQPTMQEVERENLSDLPGARRGGQPRDRARPAAPASRRPGMRQDETGLRRRLLARTAARGVLHQVDQSRPGLAVHLRRRKSALRRRARGAWSTGRARSAAIVGHPQLHPPRAVGEGYQPGKLRTAVRRPALTRSTRPTLTSRTTCSGNWTASSSTSSRHRICCSGSHGTALNIGRSSL